jgi:hypothetical protein
MLLWRAIRDAVARGYRTFDFGRSDLDNAGLRGDNYFRRLATTIFAG